MNYQKLMLERIASQKGESALNKRIHSLECDIEVCHIKIRNMKEELKVAKNANSNLEKMLKQKKNEIEKIKQDLNKTLHENDIFKRVVYDSKLDVSAEHIHDASALKNSLSPNLKNLKKGLNKDPNVSNILGNLSFHSADMNDKVDVEIQTDSQKRRDKFVQTEVQGLINSHIDTLAHISRKLSSKTADEFQEKYNSKQEIFSLPKNVSELLPNDLPRSKSSTEK